MYSVSSVSAIKYLRLSEKITFQLICRIADCQGVLIGEQGLLRELVVQDWMKEGRQAGRQAGGQAGRQEGMGEGRTDK